MSLHDAYARRTPFEIAFPDTSVVEALSAGVSEEASGRGVDDTLIEAFVTTVAAGERVREMQGPEAPPESGYALASLLYQAVHFHRAGCPLYLVDTRVTRGLAAAEWTEAVGQRAAGGAPEPPSPAGYLQLPRHLVWTEPRANSGENADDSGAVSSQAPESLDGVFWTVSSAGTLNALTVSGILPDRPGFVALPLPSAPLSDAGIWLDADVRATGPDFESALPGGELDRLYSVRAAGEILKLLGRFFAVVGGAAEAWSLPVRLAERRPSDAPPDRPPGAPPPSALAYTRVSVDG